MKMYTFLTCICLLGGVITGALAAEGRIPVYQPITITSSGSYYLTRDIVTPCQNAVITIQANNVILDFNGHAVICTNPAAYVIYVDTGNAENVLIRNGTIENPLYGIYIAGSGMKKGNYVVRNMKISRFTSLGIFASNVPENLVIENVDLTSDTNGSYGIYASSVDRLRIRNVKVDAVTQYPIYLDIIPEIVMERVISSNGGAGGIYVSNSGNIHINTSIIKDTPIGIYIYKDTSSAFPTSVDIQKNTITGTTDSGIKIEAASGITQDFTVTVEESLLEKAEGYNVNINANASLLLYRNMIRCDQGAQYNCMYLCSVPKNVEGGFNVFLYNGKSKALWGGCGGQTIYLFGDIGN